LLEKRTIWSLDEDLTLLEKNLIYPQKWFLIAKNILGRTQHNVKNRFFCLVGLHLEISVKEMKEFLRKHETLEVTKLVLEKIRLEMKK